MSQPRTVDDVLWDYHAGNGIRDSEWSLLVAEIDALRAQTKDLKLSVVAFCGPWAVAHAQAAGLPSGHLHPRHFDILRDAGARMDDFVRAAEAQDGR